MSDFDDLYDVSTYPDDEPEKEHGLSDWLLSVLRGETCPYCGKPSMFWSKSTDLYGGRDFGPVYVCNPCQAWVGCHKGTNEALGRLADAELRMWKHKAHEAFDVTWKGKALKRKEAYALLAKFLNVPEQFCHIGMFSVETCKKVVSFVDALHELIDEYEFEKSRKNYGHR